MSDLHHRIIESELQERIRALDVENVRLGNENRVLHGDRDALRTENAALKAELARYKPDKEFALKGAPRYPWEKEDGEITLAEYVLACEAYEKTEARVAEQKAQIDELTKVNCSLRDRLSAKAVRFLAKKEARR
jgi:FtsZ-binding cell division protein ZapB